MTSDPIFNEKDSRYEQVVDGHTVYARTHMKGDILYIDYVFAPPELRGKGAAGAFMKALLGIARDKGFKIEPICGYAVTWMMRHPEYNDLKAT